MTPSHCPMKTTLLQICIVSVIAVAVCCVRSKGGEGGGWWHTFLSGSNPSLPTSSPLPLLASSPSSLFPFLPPPPSCLLSLLPLFSPPSSLLPHIRGFKPSVPEVCAVQTAHPEDESPEQWQKVLVTHVIGTISPHSQVPPFPTLPPSPTLPPNLLPLY